MVDKPNLSDPARDRWLLMFAHDLRKPLCGVISSLHLTCEMLSMQEFAQVGRVLEIAVESGQDMLRMIEAMPAPTSDLDNELALSEVAFSALVEHVFVGLRAKAFTAGSQLVNRLPAGLPLLHVDANRITRLMINLVDNALQHAPGSQIRVEALPEPVTVKGKESEQGKRFVQAAVIDTGSGVPEAYRQRIFEFFFRAPSSTSKGYGLGLAFCKLVVEAHGGQIWVESGPEGGAAFWFTLPVVGEREI